MDLDTIVIPTITEKHRSYIFYLKMIMIVTKDSVYCIVIIACIDYVFLIMADCMILCVLGFLSGH